MTAEQITSGVERFVVTIAEQVGATFERFITTLTSVPDHLWAVAVVAFGSLPAKDSLMVHAIITVLVVAVVELLLDRKHLKSQIAAAEADAAALKKAAEAEADKLAAAVEADAKKL